MEKVKVIIDKNGQVKIETEGFKGKSCLDATKELEELLGLVVEDKKKPEYYQNTVNARLKQSY